MRRATEFSSIDREFEGARLGDRRRGARLVKVARALEAEPSAGFPQAMASDAELEAFYRFINNDSFGPGAILAPHVEATMARAAQAGQVLVVHDTTYVEMTGEAPRKGMGVTTTNDRQGFLAHCSLVMEATGTTPLGVAHVHTLTRTGTKWQKRKDRAHVDPNDIDRESLRWLRAVDVVETARRDRFDAIHVADAEGDSFELMSHLRGTEGRFVIRVGRPQRVVKTDAGKVSLRSVVDALHPHVFREIDIGERRYGPERGGWQTRRKHPPRDARRATVAMAATRVTFLPSAYVSKGSRPFDVNVVRVWETTPPPGENPIEWVLLTTETVDGDLALQRIVDIYRRRWVIEDFFKALKTGCSLEKRQIESYQAMRKVLALLAPIAYRLLLYRGLLRQQPDAPARRFFDPVDLLLVARGQPKPTDIPGTVAEALALLARMGGHIRNNGPPGWKTLGAGYEKLLAMKLGWRIAQENPRKM